MIPEHEFSERVQKHREKIRQTVDKEVVMQRLQVLADNPAEMLLFEQNLIAIGLIAQVLDDHKGADHCIAASRIASRFAVMPTPILEIMEKMQ